MYRTCLGSTENDRDRRECRGCIRIGKDGRDPRLQVGACIGILHADFMLSFGDDDFSHQLFAVDLVLVEMYKGTNAEIEGGHRPEKHEDAVFPTPVVHFFTMNSAAKIQKIEYQPR